MWASKGWFVFFCNPRGSEGYGEEFADLREKYGTIDYEGIRLALKGDAGYYEIMGQLRKQGERDK